MFSLDACQSEDGCHLIITNDSDYTIAIVADPLADVSRHSWLHDWSEDSPCAQLAVYIVLPHEYKWIGQVFGKNYHNMACFYSVMDTKNNTSDHSKWEKLADARINYFWHYNIETVNYSGAWGYAVKNNPNIDMRTSDNDDGVTFYH